MGNEEVPKLRVRAVFLPGGLRMIFDENEDGLTIYITHDEMMKEDIVEFILTILHGREIYQRHAHADLDDDDSNGE